MIKNYFIVGFRNLLKNKVFSLINILGLAIGLSACFSIFTIIRHEFSYDRFHPGQTRIYRVLGEETESTGDKTMFCRVPLLVSEDLRTNVFGLEKTATIIPFQASTKVNEQTYTHNKTGITGPDWFEMFHYKWLSGDPKTAMNSPNAVVITERKAHQYFGDTPLDKIVGKSIIYSDSLLVNVTGVIADWKENTDLGFTDFISSATMNSPYLKGSFNAQAWRHQDMPAWVFLQVEKGVKPASINRQLNDIAKSRNNADFKLDPILEPLHNMHFNEGIVENPIRTAHLPTLYTLLVIGVLILAMGVFNFINLSTSQSLQRAKEMGLRKVLGSSRTGVISQFIVENFMLTLSALAIALVLINPVLSGFKTYLPPGVSFDLFDRNTLLLLLTVVMLTSFLAAIYPARVLSSFSAIESMKGNGKQKGGQTWLLQKGLIVFQFTISLIFISGSLLIGKQMSYIRHKDLGFTSDAIITIDLPRTGTQAKAEVLKQKLTQLPAVSTVSKQWQGPMDDNPRGMKLKLRAGDVSDFWVTQLGGDENYISLYQIKLLGGRNLNKSDSVNEFVINESLMKLMGYTTPNDAIGKALYWNDKSYPVVGVVADLHTYSLHKKIEPLCIINRQERMGALAIKINTNKKGAASLSKALAQIDTEWRHVYPAAPFSFRFFDESIELLYARDEQAARLMNVAMSLAIFISCIGLFGLITHSTQRRLKEIGVRKVIGASNFTIVVMLSKDFLVLVTIAILIASPIAYYCMNTWLQDFAYRTIVSWWVFLVAGCIAIVLAILTISFQAIKAALSNPVKTLRME